jgi:hypothetical protein
MNPRGVVIGDDNVFPKRRCRGFAAGGPDEGTEAGEELDRGLSWIVDLQVAATELDLRHCRNCGYWGSEIREHHPAGGEIVGQDTATRTHIDFDSELVHEPERRSALSSGTADEHPRAQSEETKQKFGALHVISPVL